MDIQTGFKVNGWINYSMADGQTEARKRDMNVWKDRHMYIWMHKHIGRRTDRQTDMY